jgi:hypothetical protein
MMKQQPVRGEVGRLRWFFWRVRHAMYTTSFPWRATLLIFAIGPTLHSPVVYTFLVYVGYLICGVLDQMKKDQVFEDEIEAWKADPDNSEYEIKGNFSRRRLAGQNQIVAYRVGQLLSRMP